DHLARDPVHRKWHQVDLTFRPMYAWSERFVLPLSHDEVSQGKGSLLDRFPGDAWQKRATLRLLFAYQHAQPGKKLLFMGCELGRIPGRGVQLHPGGPPRLPPRRAARRTLARAPQH